VSLLQKITTASPACLLLDGAEEKERRRIATSARKEGTDAQRQGDRAGFVP